MQGGKHDQDSLGGNHCRETLSGETADDAAGRARRRDAPIRRTGTGGIKPFGD